MCTDTQRARSPFLQRVDYVWELIGAEVTAHAAVYLHLLVPLVQFALDDVAVNSLNQQVLQLPHILQLQLLQEQRVWQALRGGDTRTGFTSHSLIFLLTKVKKKDSTLKRLMESDKKM